MDIDKQIEFALQQYLKFEASHNLAVKWQDEGKEVDLFSYSFNHRRIHKNIIDLLKIKYGY